MIIEIKGKQVGLKFNRYAIEELGRMPAFQKIAADKKAGLNTTGFSMALIFCAYKGWCFLKEIEPELTLEDVSDWIDLSWNDPAINEKIAEVITEYTKSDFHKSAELRSQKKSELAEEAERNGVLTTS